MTDFNYVLYNAHYFYLERIVFNLRCFSVYIVFQQREDYEYDQWIAINVSRCTSSGIFEIPIEILSEVPFSDGAG